MPFAKNEHTSSDLKSTHFRHTHFHQRLAKLSCGVAIGAVLVLAGCGPKSETVEKAAPEISHKISKITNDKIITRVKKRSVSHAEGQKALDELGLGDDRHQDLKWAAKTGDKGHYVFKDVVLGGDEERITIKHLELTGAHMENDQARIDQIIIKGLSLDDGGDGKSGEISSVTLTNPSADFVQLVAQFLGGERDGFDDFEGDLSLDSIGLRGLRLQDEDDDAVISLASLNAGKTKDGTGMFTLSDFKIVGTNGRHKKKTNFNIHVGGVQIAGANLEKYSKLFSGMDEQGLSELFKGANLFTPDYKNFNVSDVNMNVAGLMIDVDTISATNTVKNGKIYSHQIMSALTIAPPPVLDGEKLDQGVKQIVEMFEHLGYKKMVFTSEQHSILDEKNDSVLIYDSHMSLKNGFKINFDLDVTGYKAYIQAAMDLSERSHKARRGKPDEVLDMLENISVKHFKLNVEDRSIVDRAFKLAAAQSGTKVSTLKTQAKMGLAFLPMMAKTELQQTLASDLTGALGKWLAKGGSLTLEIDPKTPIKVGDLVDEGTTNIDVDALGIHIRHHP